MQDITEKHVIKNMKRDTVSTYVLMRYDIPAVRISDDPLHQLRTYLMDIPYPDWDGLAGNWLKLRKFIGQLNINLEVDKAIFVSSKFPRQDERSDAVWSKKVQRFFKVRFSIDVFSRINRLVALERKKKKEFGKVPSEHIFFKMRIGMNSRGMLKSDVKKVQWIFRSRSSNTKAQGKVERTYRVFPVIT